MMNDLISRQAVLDAVDALTKWSLLDRFDRTVGIGVRFYAVKDAVKSLPPSTTPSVQPEPQWIPCSERMPEETESMFAKFYGTDKWRSSMMRKRSKRVIVTVEYPDGERRTDVASTSDGRWVDSVSVVKKKVIAWMPLPEPYREGAQE